MISGGLGWREREGDRGGGDNCQGYHLSEATLISI